MRIPSFDIRNQRSIARAACDDVPRVMLVTGPNGCGKSTLLQSLRSVSGEGRVLYVGPHRASRRQSVQWRYLGQQKIEMMNVYAGASLPNIEGLSIGSRSRSAWDFDDASSYIKFGLCQIELDRQAAISDRFDRDGEIPKGTILDVWQPLRDMSENLLPHLKFFKIDVTNRAQIQCLWNVHSKNVIVDIDDLSSGEKSIIHLFYPLIEKQVQSRLVAARGDEAAEANEHICVLMDEPELHLHPNLQGKVLDYIRKLSVSAGIQFILATHSPTIVECANSNELYLLRPTEFVKQGENQLLKIAFNDEKLDLMRDVFGSTSNITAMREILIVEGRRVDDTARVPVDERIYNFLSEEFNQLTIIPAGGKSECQKLAESLTDILRDISPELKAYALLDRDLERADAENELFYYLPVSMIENLLVDPSVIWSAIVTVRHKTTFQSEEDVTSALDTILDELEPSEVERRVKGSIGTYVFRAKDPVNELSTQVEEFVAVLREKCSDEVLQTVTEEASRNVEEIKREVCRREYFHGKKILAGFYNKHLHSTGMSKEIFVYECALQASERGLVKRFVEEVFQKIGVREKDEIEDVATEPSSDIGQ